MWLRSAVDVINELVEQRTIVPRNYNFGAMTCICRSCYGVLFSVRVSCGRDSPGRGQSRSETRICICRRHGHRKICCLQARLGLVVARTSWIESLWILWGLLTYVLCLKMELLSRSCNATAQRVLMTDGLLMHDFVTILDSYDWFLGDSCVKDLITLDIVRVRVAPFVDATKDNRQYLILNTRGGKHHFAQSIVCSSFVGPGWCWVLFRSSVNCKKSPVALVTESCERFSSRGGWIPSNDDLDGLELESLICATSDKLCDSFLWQRQDFPWNLRILCGWYFVRNFWKACSSEIMLC